MVKYWKVVWFEMETFLPYIVVGKTKNGDNPWAELMSQSIGTKR